MSCFEKEFSFGIGEDLVGGAFYPDEGADERGLRFAVYDNAGECRVDDWFIHRLSIRRYRC